LAICWNNEFGKILIWWNYSKAIRSHNWYAIEKILARFKLGDCVAICQFAKFSPSPIFVLIWYTESKGIMSLRVIQATYYGSITL